MLSYTVGMEQTGLVRMHVVPGVQSRRVRGLRSLSSYLRVSECLQIEVGLKTCKWPACLTYKVEPPASRNAG